MSAPGTQLRTAVQERRAPLRALLLTSGTFCCYHSPCSTMEMLCADLLLVPHKGKRALSVDLRTSEDAQLP